MPESKSRPRIVIVGAGPAGLMAAEAAASGEADVVVCEAMPSAGRKLLLAGRGGLNLTHSEEQERLIERFGEAAPYLRPAIEAFPPDALRAWAAGLGQETFVGTSGRVFPRAMKASPLLRAWLRRLADLGVQLRLRHRWIGWSEEGRILLETPEGRTEVSADATILALGGASWPRLGSDGRWATVLSGAGIPVAPLKPANCGFLADWSVHLSERFAGQPLKRIALTHAGHTVRGEAVITRQGIEGGAVYALAPSLRAAIETGGRAELLIDLRPDLDPAAIEDRLAKSSGKETLASRLRKSLSLPPVAVALVNEVLRSASPPIIASDHGSLARLIKSLPVRLTGTAGLERAISTAGGVALDELDGRFMLRGRPGTFVAGEMLDWEAPTGGYLLQAAMATGAAAGRGALDWTYRGEL